MAKPTAAQEKLVTEWFLDKFWPNYPAKFCGRGKGSRAISLTKMIKINPDEAERERILGNLKAQVLAHSKKPPELRNYWKIGETYVGNQLWNDEIESAMEEKLQSNLRKCNKPGCNNDVHGGNFKQCADHIEYDKKQLHEAYIRTGLDKNSPTFVEDCKQYARERLNIMLNKSN